MEKRHLTKEEREDIRVVMEATQRLLPYYEQLTSAENLNEEEQFMLDQIRQTLQDVLEYSGIMIDQINLMQIENTVDTIFSSQEKVHRDDWESEPFYADAHQSYVEYLKDLLNEQQN
jgi:hypothetical protein